MDAILAHLFLIVESSLTLGEISLGQHCSRFSPFGDNETFCGSLESQNL